MENDSCVIPSIVLFDISRQCNLNCKFCDIGEKNLEEKIDLERAKKIIKKLSENKVFLIIFTGGEPTILPGFENLLSYTDKLGLSIRILTNAYEISDKLIEKIKDVGANVTVSLHASKPEVHDHLTNIDGSWKMAMKNIKRMSENDVKLNKINFTATKFNYKEVRSMAKKVSDINSIKTILVNRYLDFGMSDSKDFGLDQEKLNKLAKKMDKINKELDIECVFGEPVPPCKLNGDYKYMTSKCIAGKDFGYVDIDGNIKTCTASNIEVGNIFEESLEKIWNNDLLKEFRSKNWFPKECVKCESSDDCGGICKFNNPHINYQKLLKRRS